MIDKYKPPRAQRMVPWRSPRTAAAMSVAQRDAEIQMAACASYFLLEHVAVLARRTLQSIAAQYAFESGALPGEFLPQELRSDWG